MAKNLTDKQRRFVELYNGNATETAKIVGYSNPMQAGGRNMQNVDICREIQERRKKEIKPSVMSRIQRQEMWTRLALDESEDTKNRLKATELLGKSEGDFITKHAMDESMSTGLAALIDRIQSGGKK